MKSINRAIIIFLIFTIIISTCGAYAASDPTVIYDDITSTRITSGISRDFIKRYTTNGMQSINILKIDLNNPNVKIDSMNNINKKRDTVENIAKARGAIAAVNGSFFTVINTDTSTGYGMGNQVESGSVFSADSGSSDVFGTFAVNDLNQGFAAFWKTDIKLISSVGYMLNVVAYNKLDIYLQCVINDRKFSTQTIGVTIDFPDMVEMIVENGLVKEIRRSMPKTDIPRNGYAVITRMSGDGQKLLDNFKVGDKISYEIKTTPTWTDLKMAITGGSILVQNGIIPAAFSHTTSDITGRNPRTAIGSSIDGKTIFLVVVDGRQPGVSVGMSQDELARLMLDAGAYDALNLDGGGSTTMVTRPQGESSTRVINTPSDNGVQRIVANAAGIFSIAPPGELDGFYITPSIPKVVTNGIVNLDIKGFDTYLNPHDIDIHKIEWKIDGPGAGGEIRNGNEFVPFGEGKYTLTAKIGNVIGICEVEALGYPLSIQFRENNIELGKNENKQLVVDGITKDGYQVTVRGQDIQFSVNGNIGVIDKNGVFTASGFDVNYITATYKGIKAYCKIKGTEEFKDEFEADDGYWSATGSGVTGKYSLTADEKYSGTFAGKLEYNFSNSNGVRTASFVFDNSYSIDNDVTRVGLWTMATNSSSNSLNIVLKDFKGVLQSVPIISKMDYNGWKYVESDLTNISRPAKIIKISVIRNETTQDNGILYFDSLRLLKDGMLLTRDILTPKNTPFKDNDNVANPEGVSSYSFVVFGQNKSPQITMQDVLLSKLVQSVNGKYDGLVMVGKGPHGSLDEISANKIKISTTANYSSLDVKSGRLINLNIENGSFRVGDSAKQWRWFVDKITNFSGKEIFIFMQNSPDLLTNDTDRNLFKQLLSEQRDKFGRKVWVFFKGDRDGIIETDGVKYVTSMGYEYGDINKFNAGRARQIIVTVRNNEATYEYKSIIN